MVSSKLVAKLAGVSQATVSRVINGSPHVRKETREKVERAMKELGYRPNMIARSLVLNRTKTLALISGGLENPFYSEVATAIINTATVKGYNTLVYFEQSHGMDEIIDEVLSHHVEGIIISSINLQHPIYDTLEQSGIPFIMINRKHQKEGHYVVLDNHTAGRLAMEHLVQLGHQRIGMVLGPANISTFLERKEGALQVLEENGIKFNPAYLQEVNLTAQDIKSAVTELVYLANPPTALLCGTDHIALIAMDILLSMNLRIPDDISVIGFDDIALAGHQAIQLTSVAHNIEQMGELGVNLLVNLIEEENNTSAYKQIQLKPNLVIRNTTAKLNH
ncbi:transcriptional regulator, LacI family [Caldalkalibacillus thermarum TA2.A1]|uniref:LacI family transcriptional regulator n=1 Tax=Caldalkalibacillus thermarum (strain TA2.A1) TaxID=986075 RepID=F5L750_CALTT|nr:LacI family DNA-binding transcriptional regulator [Caldalkalibacillus thermarum]EGL82826.1 transcriptional regulator, LacI family [Caldalkalibacillus thermarum TA2.A1]QZT34870.1 LacI family transcriptional regulator [Caldalkalibacillus thermarum TA2.A1]